MPEAKDVGALEGWFIIELFGHQRIAGFVKTIPLGGDAMLRVDVPEIKFNERKWDGENTTIAEQTIPAFTKFYSPKSVYAMTPVTEETCRTAMQSFRSSPVNTFEFRQAALPAPVTVGEVEDDDDPSDPDF